MPQLPIQTDVTVRSSAPVVSSLANHHAIIPKGNQMNKWQSWSYCVVYAGAEVHSEHFHSNLLIQVHGLATVVGRSCYKAPTLEAQRNMLKRVLLVCRKAALDR